MKKHPSAIEVFVFYEREKGESDLYQRICDVLGKNIISEEDFKIVCDKVKNMKQRDIGQLVVRDLTNLRICILSEVKNKKSISESLLSISNTIGKIDNQDFEFWFERFSSGNLELDQKMFSDLPIETLGIIAEKLDFGSQIKLRSVSRGFWHVVNQARPSIDRIWCSFHENDNSKKVAKITVRQIGHLLNNFKQLYTGEDFSERALNNMKTLLKNPRFQLKTFEWKNNLSSEFDERLIDMLNSLNHQIEIVHLVARLNGELVIDLVKTMKPETLEQIDFGNYDSIDVDRLAQLEQWKKAKYVSFFEAIPDFFRYLHHFQRLERVDIAVEPLSLDDLLLVKKCFIQNNKLKSFSIDVEDRPVEPEIFEALDLSDIYFDEKGAYFCGRYDIPGSIEYLKVTITLDGIDFDRKTEEEDY
uniref:F-box domain-containing protein n=1 Tax=Caenorhabditis tropicalis TaxID=1561998 RepID=A0A1I7UMZ4_9PELO